MCIFDEKKNSLNTTNENASLDGISIATHCTQEAQRTRKQSTIYLCSCEWKFFSCYFTNFLNTVLNNQIYLYIRIVYIRMFTDMCIIYLVIFIITTDKRLGCVSE